MEHVSAWTRTAEFEWRADPVPGQVDALLAFLFERPIAAEQNDEGPVVPKRPDPAQT
jgi:hypothetical protein